MIEQPMSSYDSAENKIELKKENGEEPEEGWTSVIDMVTELPVYESGRTEDEEKKMSRRDMTTQLPMTDCASNGNDIPSPLPTNPSLWRIIIIAY